jgi:uncharacterized protein YoxC
MFEEIPSIYWMIIIGVPVGFFTFILYQLGMFIKDSRGIVTEAKQTLNKTNKMLDDAQEIVNTAKSTVNEVQQSIITPIRAIGNVLSRISGLVERLKRN